jgi:hypothetical protein
MHHHEENDPVDSETFNVGLWVSKVGTIPDQMQENERATGVSNLKIVQASTERNTLNF